MVLKWNYVWLYDVDKGREYCIAFLNEIWIKINMYPTKLVKLLQVELYKQYCKEKVP